MEKLKMKSFDNLRSNVDLLMQLFPSCVKEGKSEAGMSKLKIDIDALKLELSDVDAILCDEDERYQFTWPDKKKSIRIANTQTSKTLRPDVDSSIDFNGTKNVYIEGENLDVLKILQETYLGAIKLIYIDPPYNTGNDFVYGDNYAQQVSEYINNSGQLDEYGNCYVQNTETNGRFHTDWLNMIYPRLKIARNLLSEDGVIFISIDDNEVRNLKMVCDEIFGETNFIAQVVWERAFSPKNDAKYFSDSHDYILVYAKSIAYYKIGKLERTNEMDSRYKNPDNDPRGPWSSGDLTAKTYSSAYDYPIVTPSGKIVYPTSGRCWNTSKERMEELIKEGRIWFGKDGNNTPRFKRFLSEMTDGIVPTTLWKYDEVGHNQEARQEVKKLFDGKGYFDGPKPLRLIEKIMKIANLDDNSIVLDFFSGSGTTAHAVLNKNYKEKKHIKYIMVQLPETVDKTSVAYKDGYYDICKIGEARIARAGKKIKEEHPEAKDLDTGFRVLKLDSSNMNDVYYTPAETTVDIFNQGNIKSDRTNLDLLFQVMLESNVELSAKIEEKTIGGKTVYFVEDNYLVACFDEDVTESVITEIAKEHPYYFVLRDSSMASDNVADNFEQIFRAYSPDTIRKVL